MKWKIMLVEIATQLLSKLVEKWKSKPPDKDGKKNDVVV